MASGCLPSKLSTDRDKTCAKPGLSFRPVKTGKSAADFAMIFGGTGRTKAEKAVDVAVCDTANLSSGQFERPLFQKPPDIRFASALQHANVALQQIQPLIAAENAVGQE